MATSHWDEANQRYLAAALALVRNALERHAARIRGTSEVTDQQTQALQQALELAASALLAPSALTKLCAAFDLSPFERDIVLLCAGMEFDGTFASLCAAAQGLSWDKRDGVAGGYTGTPYPTFSLALAALPCGHWDALIPAAPLRRWQLITVGTGNALTLSPLRIDERILHYLAGASHLDERLASTIIPVPATAGLVPSHSLLAKRLVTAWSSLASTPNNSFLSKQREIYSIPTIQLYGEDSTGKYAIASTTCTEFGLNLYSMSSESLPVTSGEIEAFTRLWEREAALSESVLLLDCYELDMTNVTRTAAITQLITQMDSPLIISSHEQYRLSQERVRLLITFDVHKPSVSEQRSAWQSTLEKVDLNGHVDTLVSQFNLSMSAIHAASTSVLETSSDMFTTPNGGLLQTAHENLGTLLWDACRLQARPRLDDLAQRIEASTDWDDLVLPEAQRQILCEIAAHVRRRATVYETWGVGNKGTRGLGISALFAGPSGTGKTLAAEVLAHELRLDLYRIDLSSVVSKYIGETEKNLRHVFDAAEEGGAVLLFDEADALFGKRSEVKDSHDRYANIEVSYLLQRMEAYRGLAILTTNLKNALDTAFLRRIRFIVHFPFPDGTQRAEIWRRIFPQQMPTESLDMSKLARLNVAGGNIRNIMLNAAFLAADAHEPVRMVHLLRAASTEYAKLEKPLTQAEIGGWL